MRARRTISVPTAAKLAVGASVLAFPATAVAITSDGNAAAASPQAVALHDVHTVQTAYGVGTVVRGTAPAADAGTGLKLEYRPNDSGRWRTVDRGDVARNGHFKLLAHIGRSGEFEVMPAGATKHVPNQTAGTGTQTTPASTDASLAPSAVSHIVVKPNLKLAAKTATAIVGQTADVKGRLLPGIAGRKVELQVRKDGHWVGVAKSRTRRGGAFDVRFTAPAVANEVTRVAFVGDRFNSAAHSNLENVSGMMYAEVSWYYDAGDTACGFHATYGIASRTLPCGSKVTMSYHGRTVTATVDDRGPFVYSRLYDLNQTTAAALGMNGVATILASV